MSDERPKLMPLDTPDYMAAAWAGCVHFAISTPEIVKTFRAETGNQWTPATNAMDAAIDKACGADVAFIEAFIGWVNVNIWGPMDGNGPGLEGD